MLARCTNCQQTFRTDTFGRQKCPSCGAEVELREPTVPATPAPTYGPEGSAPASPYAPPHTPVGAPPGEGAPEGRLTPWERRAELGFWKALGQTLQGALFEPGKFFGSMRYDTAEGAHLYFFVVAVIPNLIALLFSRLIGSSQAEVDQALEQLKGSGALDPHMLDQIRDFLRIANGPGAFLAGLFFVPLAAYAQLYLFAGLSHLTMLLLGKAQGGWTATFKTFVYAYSAGVFGIVPSCGGLIVLMWASALEMIGLSKGHKTTVGYGVAGVLAWHALFWCCCCIGPATMAMLAIQKAAGGP